VRDRDDDQTLGRKNEIWGVDVSIGLLKIAARNGIYTFRGSADSLPFRRNFFDIVLCIGVIPYYKNPKKIFSEIGRVSHEQGKIIVTSTTNSLLIKFVRYMKNLTGIGSQLEHLYTVNEISEHITENGGKVIDACIGGRNRFTSITQNRTPLRYRLFGLTAAVLATAHA